MRILHILDHSIPLHSGYTFRTLSILKEQRALGFETSHITSPKQGDSGSSEEHVDGWHFFRTPERRSWLSRAPALKQLNVINRLASALEEAAMSVKPDILHAHSPALNAIAALRVGRKLGIPVVYEIRAFWEDAAVDHGTSKEWGVRYRLTRALETYALRHVDAVTTICEGLRGDIVARGIPQQMVTVIPNAVNIEDFNAGGTPEQALARELDIEGKIVLGYVGSFYAYEGLNILLQALPVILEQRPNVSVLLVGGGPEERALKALAVKLGLEDKVVFTGRVAHKDVQRYYNLIDVLVYPRLQMRLTDLVTPLKPLEAMAQEKLVVASDVGGHRELITDGATGILFQAGSSSALAQKLLTLLGTPERWREIGKSARNFVERERNWRFSAARYSRVYEGLVEAAQA